MQPHGDNTYKFPPTTFQDPIGSDPSDLFHQPPLADPPVQHTPLVIVLPPMAPSTRSSVRHQTTPIPSGSEYNESSMDVDNTAALEQDDAEEQEEEQPVLIKTRRGRSVRQISYVESSDHSPDRSPDPMLLQDPVKRNGDGTDSMNYDGQNGRLSRLRKRNGSSRQDNGFVEDERPEIGEVDGMRYNTRSRSKNPMSTGQRTRHDTRRSARQSGRSQRASSSRVQPSRPGLRSSRRTTQPDDDEDGYVQEASEGGSADGDGSFDEDAPRTSSDVEADHDAEGEPDGDADIDDDGDDEGDAILEPQDGRKYAFRQRQKINYAIPPPIEELHVPPKPRSNGRANGRVGGGHGAGRSKAPGWSASGAELSRWIGAGDDSDSDYNTRTPRKPFGVDAVGSVFAGGAGSAGGGLLPSDLAAAGTPSNLGKVGDAALADADPLGVNLNVTFDEVGGLDDHINSLKEMTLLPLLYPEVFQRFNVTPPRGVLFHGPPGTGKTLLARALAASCRSNGKGITFFMRKGADCLSKWVGEAERQLRLLFEEARNSQPSIIFFDEIDGLAPVRSSKQDQIHASIVSTLLALMDGMDGRGQVVVIGATNRPDAVDPALRRPGRFDREFYFPLPTLEAREKIIRIMTQKWAGWEGEKGEVNAKGLAKLTKGYGGADLRALCTEAALNAVQRRYPQIYKSNDRLLLEPATIDIELRDFMISVKKIVPSSARTTASAASSLPPQLIPLLQDGLDRVKEAISKVMPMSKKRTALEEAEWEDEGDEGAMEREMLMQSMETLRVYRPRVILHGPAGMGQNYVASAALHHLEGYHIQSLDLGTIMSDSARTPEAAIVQLFVEAKRHQPSVIYIPSLFGWCAAISETTRTTVRAMLDSLAATDPVLLFAVADGPFSSLPRDVRSWFGVMREARVQLVSPNAEQREDFFDGIIQDIHRPPHHFPDGVKRKRRMLEQLPVAPPLEPRAPSAAELALQEDNDQKAITLLRYRLGPILTELKRKFKRFTKRAIEEYNFDIVQQVETVTTTVETQTTSDGIIEVVSEQRTEELIDRPINEITNVSAEPPLPPQAPPQPQLFDMDLEKMHVELYKNKYLTPDDFLDDIRKIVHNAHARSYEDLDRLYRAQAMLTAAEVSIQDFDPQFRAECQRMAARERQRRSEYKKSKCKDKATAANTQNGGDVYAPGTRRSARNNGQEPEMAITDPLKLERKLKRQRSAEASAVHSEEENSEARAPKRSKTSGSDENDDHDPLNVIGPTSPSSSQRLPSVRFVDDLTGIHTPIFVPHTNGITQPSTPEPPRRTGFDPSLLNPVPLNSLSSESNQASSSVVNGIASNSTPEDTMHQPTLPEALQAGTLLSSSEELNPFVDSALFASGMETDIAGMTNYETKQDANGTEGNVSKSEIEAPLSAEQPDEPMQVESAPPLPEFVLDEDQVIQLKAILWETSSLNIEQLEQLRATCLACVWRHRTEWDRTKLLDELNSTVREYIHEVSDVEIDALSSPVLSTS